MIWFCMQCDTREKERRRMVDLVVALKMGFFLICHLTLTSSIRLKKIVGKPPLEKNPFSQG